MADPVTKKWYEDKAFWVGVLGILAPLVSKFFGISLDVPTLATIITLAASFIVGHKLESAAEKIAVAHKSAVETAAKTKVTTAEGAADAINSL